VSQRNYSSKNLISNNKFGAQRPKEELEEEVKENKPIESRRFKAPLPPRRKQSPISQ